MPHSPESPENKIWLHGFEHWISLSILNSQHWAGNSLFLSQSYFPPVSMTIFQHKTERLRLDCFFSICERLFWAEPSRRSSGNAKREEGFRKFSLKIEALLKGLLGSPKGQVPIRPCPVKANIRVFIGVRICKNRFLVGIKMYLLDICQL